MKKNLFAIMLTMLLTACSSLEISNVRSFNQLKTYNNNKNVVNISAELYGYYLFSYIPIIVGDPNSINSFKLFEDLVTLRNTHNMVTSKAKEIGATKTLYTHSNIKWTGSFTLWVFWLKDIKVSTVAVKDAAP